MLPDIIILAIIILIFIRGYKQGFIVAVFSLLAVLVGTVCSLKLAHTVADFVAERGIIQSSWGLIISYLALFLLVLFLVRFIANLIEKAFRAMLMGWLNGLSGGILYALAGILICSSLLWLADRAYLIPQKMYDESIACSYILPIAPWAFDGLGDIAPAAKDVMLDIEDFFSGLNDKLSEHVGADR